VSGQLDHSPADIIAQYLDDNSIGVIAGTGNWAIYVGYEMDDPDDSITVYDTTPIINGRLMPTGETQQFYGVQVRIRDSGYNTAYAKANAIEVIFDAADKASVTIDSSTYLIQAIHHQGTSSIGREAETNRRLLTINALVTARKTS